MPSSSLSASLMSFLCPGDRMIRTGLPKASTSAWILVDGPPRERPISWGPLFCRARRVLMGAHDRGIDKKPLGVMLASQCLKQPRQYTGVGPAGKSRVDRLPRAVGARHISPRSAGPQNPDQSFDHELVGLGRSSALL